jgi:hypothetical protein
MFARTIQRCSRRTGRHSKSTANEQNKLRDIYGCYIDSKKDRSEEERVLPGFDKAGAVGGFIFGVKSGGVDTADAGRGGGARLNDPLKEEDEGGGGSSGELERGDLVAF